MATLKEPLEPNSRAWWENYFSTKWEANHGREQTRHFMERMIAALPNPVRKRLSSGPVSILDWGCALGDGVDVLGHAFPNASAYGFDFAERAVSAARRYYPKSPFLLAGRDPLSPSYNAIFCSNCLEHFEDPVAVVTDQLVRCKEYYALLVPYNEHPLCEYHVVTLREESFPESIGGFHKIYQSTVKVEPAHWPGEQLLVVYGNSVVSDRAA